MPDLVFTSKGSAEVLRQQTLLNEKAAEMAQIYKDDARAARDLESAVGRIFKNVKEPSKQFNEEMGKLLRNMKDGKINAEQYAKGIARLEKAYGDANTFGGRLKGTMLNMFGADSLKMLQNYALGFTGAGGLIAAVSLLKSEYQAVIDLQDKATGVKMTVGQARNVMIRNMLGSSPKEISGVLGQTTALAGELKLPESVVAQAMAEAMSANSGDAGSALKAVKLAGKFLPDQPDEIGEFAGALLDLQKASGSADPRVNFGLLASISQRSRVATPRAIAMNAPEALIGSAGLAGATGAEGAALYSALTNASGDKTGATSSSAQIAFSKSLGLVFDAELRKPINGQADIADQLAGMSMGGKIAMLQQNPELARQFFATSGVTLGEGKAVAPLRDLLLNPNSVMARNYAANLASMPNDAGLGRLADEAIGNFRLNPMEPLAKTSRTIGSLHEQTLAQFPDTLGAEDRQKINEIMRAGGGRSNLGTRLEMMMGQFNDGKVGTSIEDARDLFAAERSRLRSPYMAPTFGPGGGGDFYEPGAKESVDRLDKVISALDKLLEENKKNTQAVKDIGGIPVTNN